MKNILLELRMWLGLSQIEMSFALDISRSSYSMAELGMRTIDAESALFILALHRHLENAAANELVLQIEKEEKMQLLTEVEEKIKLCTLQNGINKRTEKYKETFPERALPLPVPELNVEENEKSGMALSSIKHFTNLRIHRYRKGYQKDLRAELELVRNQAAAEYLRKKMDSEA